MGASLVGCSKEKCDPCPSQSEPEPAHEHTFSSDWSSNATSHWHAATCEHRTMNSDLADHEFGEWTTVEATETAEGNKTRECSICHYVQTEVLPKKAHEHAFSDEYTADDEYHWHEATCGHDLISGLEAHDYGSWTTIDEPTETEVGSKERTCSICGHVQSAEIERLPHTHSWSQWIIDDEATEDHPGKKHRECACGATQEEIIDQLEHTHTFEDAWTSNEQYHWHEASCGHKEISGKAAHTPDRAEPDYKTPVKCSVCGRVLEESLINAAVDMSNDEYVIKPGQTRYFVLRNVGEPTELKVNIDYISGGSDTGSIKPEMLGISNPFTSYANKTTVKEFASITKAELSGGRITLISGKNVNVTTVLLVFAVTNNMSNNIALRLNNVTYEYKMTFSSTTTINGHKYKIERFTAQNGVDDVYYAVYNNSSGARIGVYRDLKITNPDVLIDGSVEWKDANGDLKQFTLPHTLYKSQHYKTNEIWYVDELYEGRLYLWLGDLSKFVDFLMNDEIYGVPGLFATNSEEQFEALAVFAEDNVQFTLTDFYDQFDFEDGGAPYGVREYEGISDDAIAMDYNSSNRQFRYVGDSQYSQNRRIKVLKLTTPENIQYDKFFSYDQNGVARQPVGPVWSAPFLYRIVDSNLNEVAGYDKLTNSGFRQNANGENLRLMPNQTYYIVGYQWLFGYNFVVSQRRYSINIVSHEVEGFYEEGQVIASLNDRVTGQTTGINGCFGNTYHIASEADAKASGKAIVGYTTDPNNTALNSIQYLHRGALSSITPQNDDITLYAMYADIEDEHVITTTAYTTSISAGSNQVVIKFGSILDPNITSLGIGEAVYFVRHDGSRTEGIISNFSSDASNGLSYTISGINATTVNYTAYIALEVEHDLLFSLDEPGRYEHEVIVNKGEPFDLASIYSQVIIPSGKYLYQWEDLDTEEKYYANTIFNPYHGTIYVPVFMNIDGSDLLTLYQEFETGENNLGAPYIEFEIQDGSATLNSDSNVVMILRDGTQVTDSVARILNSNNSTITSANKGSGTIKVFFNATTLAQLGDVVMIHIA